MVDEEHEVGQKPVDGDAALEQVSVVVEVAYDAVAVLLAVVYKGEDEALLVNQPRMLE